MLIYIDEQEFFKFLGDDNYTPNIIQKMTRVFALAVEQISLDDIFSELDLNNDGSINSEELRAGLVRLNLFPGEHSQFYSQGTRSICDTDLSLEDTDQIVKLFDKDGDAKISRPEFVEFFSGRIKQVTRERQKKRANLVASKFRGLMQTAVSKGARVDDLFVHLDKDKGGQIDKKELFNALKAIKQFDSITADEVDTLFAQLDTDNSGDISIEEFKAYVGNVSLREDATTIARSQSGRKSFAGKHFQTTENLVKLRKILVTALNNPQHPLTVEKIFKNADGDHSGSLGLEELAATLHKFRTFKDISDAEVSEMLRELDTDGSGEISLEEFKHFLQPEGEAGSAEKSQNKGLYLHSSISCDLGRIYE